MNVGVASIRARVSSTLLLATLAATSADANWLTTRDLQRHCSALLADATSAEGATCLAFIQGFLAGAASLGSRVATSTPETGGRLAARAAAVRGAARLEQMEAQRNRYCIAPDLPAAAVAERVGVYLEARVGDSASAEEVLSQPVERFVRRALVASFPCDDGDR